MGGKNHKKSSSGLKRSDHALRQSSQRWREKKHDLLPWLNLLLGIIRRAYIEFEPRAGKTELLRQTLEKISGDFTLSGRQ